MAKEESKGPINRHKAMAMGEKIKVMKKGGKVEMKKGGKAGHKEAKKKK